MSVTKRKEGNKQAAEPEGRAVSGTEKKNGNGKEKMGNGKEDGNGKKTWGTTKCQRQKESKTGKERKEAKKNKMKSESPGNALFEARFAVASILPCFAALPSLPPSLPPSPSATKKSKPTSVLCSTWASVSVLVALCCVTVFLGAEPPVRREPLAARASCFRSAFEATI